MSGCTSAGACLRAGRLTYTVCHAHAPYCLRPRWLHHIFRHYLTNDTIFGKKVTEHKMCVLIFSPTFLILRRIQRDIVININVFTYSARYSRRNLMKLEFSGQIHEKVSNINFFQNPCSGNRDVPRDRQMDRRRRSDCNS